MRRLKPIPLSPVFFWSQSHKARFFQLLLEKMRDKTEKNRSHSGHIPAKKRHMFGDRRENRRGKVVIAR